MSRLLRMAVVGVLLAGLAGCGGGNEVASSTTTVPPTVPEPPETTASLGVVPPTTATPAPDTTTGEETEAEHVVRAYFVGEDERVHPVSRQVTGEGVAAGAIRGLLEGPTAAEAALGLGTNIPEGTVLNGVSVADGIATVDLSGAFGSGGGSASILSRVAQVVFTLTQFPTVNLVQFEMDGQSLAPLGGEGLLLDDLQTRDDYEGLSPAILVESPLPFSEVTSPFRLTGTANTFEATFQIRITAPDGTVLYDEFATATSGTGTRGTFDVTAPFELREPGTGALTVYEISAEDGSEINAVTIPVEMS